MKRGGKGERQEPWLATCFGRVGWVTRRLSEDLQTNVRGCEEVEFTKEKPEEERKRSRTTMDKLVSVAPAGTTTEPGRKGMTGGATEGGAR
jgi:hypothetical protein